MAKKYSASGENRGLSVDSKSPLSDTENLALRILLSLLRAGLQTGSGTEQLPGVIEEAQWNEVYHSGNYLGRHTQLVCRIPDSENFETGLGLQYRNYRSKVRPAEKNGHRNGGTACPGRNQCTRFQRIEHEHVLSRARTP